MSSPRQDENLPEAPDWRPQRFSLAALRNRPGSWLVCAFPPAFVAFVILAVSMGESARVEQHQTHYLKAMDKAYGRRDFAAVNRFFTKLKQYNYKENPNARFIGAVLDTRAGRLEDAARNLNAVAPPDGNGFRPAHLWRAKELLDSSPNRSPEQLKKVRHHLEAALGIREEEAWIRSTLGRACAALGDYPAALENFGRVVDQQPELYILIAGIHAKQGNTDSQIAALEKATQAFLRKLQREPDNASIRVAVASLYHDQGDLRNAVNTAEEGLARSPQNRELRMCMSKIMISQFDQLRTTGDEEQTELTQQLAVLERALELDASNQLAVVRLQSLMEGSDEDQVAVKAALKKMLVKGQSTGTVHFLLGTHAVQENDIDSARFHFQQSYTEFREGGQDGQIPSLLNNIAWLMLQDGKDMEEAAQLVDQGIELLEKGDRRLAFMRETRGQILIRLKKWETAISDLEFALSKLPNNQPEIHGALATAYEGLGKPDIAAEHKKLATAK